LSVEYLAPSQTAGLKMNGLIGLSFSAGLDKIRGIDRGSELRS
jgi:hypothetical protein